MSLKAFHSQIINPPTKIAAIGSGCSIATEASAEVSHFYNITQVTIIMIQTITSIMVCKFVEGVQLELLTTPVAYLRQGLAGHRPYHSNVVPCLTNGPCMIVVFLWIIINIDLVFHLEGLIHSTARS